MNKRRVLLCKVGSIMVLLGLLVTFTFISDARVTHAASRVSQSAMQPACAGRMWASPFHQDIRPFTEANVTAYWSCEGAIHVVANIDWNDGQSDNYTCWANCGNGNVLFSHRYTYIGIFEPSLWMSGFASGSTVITVHVG